jgi:prolyl-tRNA editing enzyme YbaK/EbsC (Cys-tRNA(Pro) deacylase)
MEVFKKLKHFLKENKIEFREINHQPTFTSEQSANVRGEDLSVGGKALVMKIDDEFKLFVLSASRKIDSKKIKQHFNVKKTRFASEDELKELTGLVPGAVPPFGRPIIDLDLYADNSITENERIAFNAGSLSNSFILETADYLRIAKPEIIDFAED